MRAVTRSLWPAPLPAPKPAPKPPLCCPSQALCPAPPSTLSVRARSGSGVMGLSLALFQAHPLTFHVEVPSVSGPAEWQQGPPPRQAPVRRGRHRHPRTRHVQRAVLQWTVSAMFVWTVAPFRARLSEPSFRRRPSLSQTPV